MIRGNARIIPAHPGAVFLPYQSRWAVDKSRLKIIEKSRQIGMSWATAYAADERTAAADNRHDQWVSSRDEIQAGLFIIDCQKFARVLEVVAKDMGEVVIDPKHGWTARVLQFANGKRIYSMSSNPDAQAGKRGGRVLDEFALHPDPRKLWTVAYPGITWGGSIEVISTHRGSANFFAELLREITENGNPKGFSHHRVTLEDALSEGFLFKLQENLPEDDSRQAMNEEEYFDFIRSGCADEESFLQEYMCQPADDAGAFLEYDLIASCEFRAGERWEYDTPDEMQGELYAGLDIGRKKDLTCLWVLERLGDILYTRKIITLKNMSKPDQEKILWPFFPDFRRLCIDETGLGIGWTDDAKRKFGEYRVEGVTFTNRTKETLAYPVRAKFEDRSVRIPYDRHIRADLRSVTKTTTSAGNIRFTAERSEEGHADRFWALALAIHAAGSVSAEPLRVSVGPKRQAQTLTRGYAL